MYNRINNEGKLLSGRNDYRRNEQVTKALKSRYGLTYGTDKSNTNTRKLRNAERAKYEIHNAVNDALEVADSWQKFKNELAKRGVRLELVYKDKERTKVQGIRFCKDGYSFKGTQISRGYSFGKLNARFEGMENHVSPKSIDKLARLREAICIFTDLTKKEASNGEQRSKLLFDAINQVKQELNATSKNVQEKLHAMGNTPQKKIVTHRFEPTSKYVLLFIGGLALSLVISIWGNFTQWREYQDWEEADLKYRALKMVLPSDDPNVRYIEKFFSVCRDEKVIDDVKNRVAAYEDSVYHHYKMVKMAAIKDSIANSLFKEANEIKKKINKK